MRVSTTFRWYIMLFLLALSHAFAVPVAPAVIPHITFVNAIGLPCAGCKLYTYTGGTTTPQATYTDSTGTSVNTNPITLDIAGGANIWVGSTAYKFILKDPLGATIWTVDQVSQLFPCGTSGTVQISNTSGTGLTCDSTFTYNVSTHTLSVNNLNAVNLNGMANAALFAGADIGVKVNAAIASIGCGTVLVPAGSYNYSHQIIKPECILLIGQGSSATKLNWTPTTGVAVAIGSAHHVGDSFTGMQGISFRGTGTGLGTTNASVGVWFGGDPANVVLPTAYEAEIQTLTDVYVVGFEIGITYANEAFLDKCISCNISNNWIGITQAAGSITDSGENNSFDQSTISNNTGGAFSGYLLGTMFITDTSLDFNTDGTDSVVATHAPFINSGISMKGGHVEQKGALMFSGAQEGKFYQVDFLAGGPATTEAVMFTSASGLDLTGNDYFVNHVVTALAGVTGGSPVNINIKGGTGNGNGNIQAYLTAGNTAPPSIDALIPFIPQVMFYNGSINSGTGGYNGATILNAHALFSSVSANGGPTTYTASSTALSQSSGTSFIEAVGPNSTTRNPLTLRGVSSTGVALLEYLNCDITGACTFPGNLTVSGTCTGCAGGSSPLTTKGDIYGYSTTNARIPVGSNGQQLTSDSSNANGVSWQSRRWSCQPGLGDGLNAVSAGTYPQTSCRNETGSTITLTAIRCITDTGTSTCAVTNGAGTSLLTGPITGTPTYANGTQSGTTTIAAGDYLKISFVLDGTTTQIGIDLAGTY